MYNEEENEKDREELLNLLIEALRNELDDMFLESLDSPVWDGWVNEGNTSTDQLDFDIL